MYLSTEAAQLLVGGADSASGPATPAEYVGYLPLGPQAARLGSLAQRIEAGCVTPPCTSTSTDMQV